FTISSGSFIGFGITLKRIRNKYVPERAIIITGISNNLPETTWKYRAKESRLIFEKKLRIPCWHFTIKTVPEKAISNNKKDIKPTMKRPVSCKNNERCNAVI